MLFIGIDLQIHVSLCYPSLSNEKALIACALEMVPALNYLQALLKASVFLYCNLLQT